VTELRAFTDWKSDGGRDVAFRTMSMHALNLEEDQVGTVLLGEYTAIKEGDTSSGRTRYVRPVAKR